MISDLRRLEQAAQAGTRERRRSGRVPCANFTTNYGRVVDLSTVGIRIRTARVPRLSQDQVVTLKLKGPTLALKIQARTVRCVAAAAEGGYDLCFEFLDQTPEFREMVRQAALACDANPDR
jgi:hypothetical protein